MNRSAFSRRDALVTGVCAAVAVTRGSGAFAQTAAGATAEVDLVDEPTRGYYATFDVDNFGPPVTRKVNRDFVYPKDVDVASGYGIDVSHHTDEVPWDGLKSSKINYVYIKASQSRNGRDARFVEFWSGASRSELPFGAYHFLTAGVPGHDQSTYFLKRLAEVGGLKSGNLQPVFDLEWDIYGPDFKTVVVGRTPQGNKIYKDYWDDLSKESIVETVNDSVSAIIAASASMALRPIIYTNRSWWEAHVPPGTVFPHCTIWISDYRQQSYANNSPRSVPGHDYFLWQFTDRALIAIGDRTFGPYDSNKLVFGGLSHLLIA